MMVAKSLFTPTLLALCFFLIPTILALVYPISFWLGNDYEPLGLANAMNMAFRLANHQMYPAPGMAGHPGVPFYFMNWLALALAGYPLASGGLEFLQTVIDHLQHYQRIAIFLAASAGAAGVYIFTRVAQSLAPTWVTLAGLLMWLVSTPASIATFLSPSHESFAIFLNALFFSTLLRLAHDKRGTLNTYLLVGGVSALAYLNKLSYVYILAALVGAIVVQYVFSATDRKKVILLLFAACLAFGLVVLATAYTVIGWSAFLALLSFHRSVMMGSGLYGTGSQTIVSPDEIRSAILAIPADAAYAIPMALVGGLGLVVAGTASILKKRQTISEGIIIIGSGLAAFLSAVFVMKHYHSHYAAGVSATIPACAVSYYLLAKRWQFGIAIATVAILMMAYPVLRTIKDDLDNRLDRTRLAELDLKDIMALTAGSKKVVDFAYRTPFSQYGEGFVVYYAGVQPLTDAYVKDRHGITNSLTEALVKEDVGAYVIDKTYFPSAEAVKLANNFDLLGPSSVQYKEGDKLFELRTVFLLVRN
jgi:hypothetical protein